MLGKFDGIFVQFTYPSLLRGTTFPFPEQQQNMNVKHVGLLGEVYYSEVPLNLQKGWEDIPRLLMGLVL